jgi:hypothetical protein
MVNEDGDAAADSKEESTGNAKIHVRLKMAARTANGIPMMVIVYPSIYRPYKNERKVRINNSLSLPLL